MQQCWSVIFLDWPVDTTDPIMSDASWCGRRARSLTGTSGHRCRTESCCWLAGRPCAELVSPSVRRDASPPSVIQHRGTWSATLPCPLPVIQGRMVVRRKRREFSSGCPCSTWAVHHDDVSHAAVLHRRYASECVSREALFTKQSTAAVTDTASWQTAIINTDL